MKQLKYMLIAVFLYSVSSFSQSAFYSPFEINQQKTQSVSQDIRSAVDEAKIVDVNKEMINRIVSEKSDKINIRLPLDNRYYDLTLERFDILAPGYKVVGGTQTGDRDISGEVSFVTYTSSLKDKNSPTYVFTFFKDEASAIVMAGDETYVLARMDKNDVNSDYILFRASKVKFHSDFKCGADALEIPEKIRDMQRNLTNENKDFGSADILRADIAVESDFETFTYYGGTLNATNYILRLMSPVSAIYVRDMNIKLQVNYLRVWETSNDPYPDATSSNTLLNSFRAYWNSNMSSVPRTIAHYITTRPGGLGGIAWVGVLCSNPTNGLGYAFSDIDGTFNNLPAYSWDVMVVAHETGHNFGSPHTHSCSWPGGPIDSCYEVEGGCYTGPAFARVGTIMSYCHLNGSISLSQGFGPLPVELIRQRAETAGCLTSSTGYLVAMPNGGEIMRANTSTLLVWGTSQTGNINIEYTTNNGTNWQVIQNNVSASLRNISWVVPSLNATTTQARVRIYQTGNPGNGDQSDSVFHIRPALLPFNMLTPVQLSRYYTAPGDTTRIHFVNSSAGNLAELRYKFNLNNFANTLNYNQPANNNGVDTTTSITLGKVDSLMAAWGVAPGDSLRGRWMVRAYSQLDSLYPSTNNFLITFIRGLIGIQPISQVIPKEYFVNPNYPNPFNPVTKIKFGLPKQSFVKITVYNILGKEVAVLAKEQLNAGEFEVDWNADSYPSGVYFYRIEAGSFIKTAKMMLVK
jgi:hypothetical protein